MDSTCLARVWLSHTIYTAVSDPRSKYQSRPVSAHHVIVVYTVVHSIPFGNNMKASYPVAYRWAVAMVVLTRMFQESASFVLPALAAVQTSSAAGNNRGRSSYCSELRGHDILVTMPGGTGVQKTVPTGEGQSILDALEANGIDAPHSCRSGLCTE